MGSRPAATPAEVLVRELSARATFAPAGTEATCAVSGGADSLALLVLAAEAGLAVTAVHVDHGARAGSADEADVVAAVAAQVGAAFECRSVRVPRGPNQEARWREARRSVLPPDALTGHTADDQAETVLVNLLRGSGLDGLAGMRPGPTKPLLRLRRRETRELCAVLGLDPVEDPTNADPAFVRNRIRHELLPLLDDVAGRDVAWLLARQADLLRDEAALVDELAGAVDATDARAVAAAPGPLARRAVRRWLRTALGSAHPPDAASVERVLSVARGDALACELPGGARVSRSGMRLRVTGPPRDA